LSAFVSCDHELPAITAVKRRVTAISFITINA
jgi:hypothetical protein